MLLEIRNLNIATEEKTLLKNINLTIKKGETHLLLGPNGSGKSTLFKSIMNYPNFTIAGEIIFAGENIITLPTDEIANKGVYLSHQSPKSIEGVKYASYLKELKRLKQGGGKVKISDIKNEFHDIANTLGLDINIWDRDLNVDLSGGEMKKSELIQLTILKPKLVLIDEIDSGLDITAIKKVGDTLKKLQQEIGFAMVIITHNLELIKYFKINHIHIIEKGCIIKNGGIELLELIHKEGWDKIN